MTVSELPEASFVRKTFTVKKMDLPPEVSLTKRSLLRWFALSFGLISEKESRDYALSILDALFYFLLTKKTNPSTLDIKNYLVEKYSIKTSEKLIRYHLNKLIEIELIQRKKNLYSFNPAPKADRGNISASFDYWVKQEVIDSLNDISSVVKKLSDSYS